MDTAHALLSTVTTAQVNAEVVDALDTDTYAEPGQGAPPSTASITAKLGHLYKVLINKLVTSSTLIEVYAADESTVDYKSIISDDGDDFTRGEFKTGP